MDLDHQPSQPATLAEKSTPATDVIMNLEGGDIFIGNIEASSNLDAGASDNMDTEMETTEEMTIDESDTRCPYAPQFSAAQSLILRLMKTGHTKPLTPVSERPASAPPLGDEHQTSNTSTSTRLPRCLSETLTMARPVASKEQPVSAIARSDAQNHGLKRKQDQEPEGFDFTEDTVSLPVPPWKLAPPILPQSTANETKACFTCHLDTSTPENIIISCSACVRSWHQQCTLPAIKDEVAQTSALLCVDCMGVGGNDDAAYEIINPQMRSEMEDLRARNLAALPAGVVPAKAALVGFPGGQASDLALTEYFYGKKKTDLLNILSFCDQLKPQLLVDVLVSVARRHPDLPIFDSPGWNTEASGTSSVKHKHQQFVSRPVGKPRHSHTVLDVKIRQKHKTTRKIVKVTSVVETNPILYEDNRSSLPPMWPKAGEGLYAKLKAEDQDRLFLLDENDEEAFSHFGVDKRGKQIAISACG